MLRHALLWAQLLVSFALGIKARRCAIANDLTKQRPMRVDGAELIHFFPPFLGLAAQNSAACFIRLLISSMVWPSATTSPILSRSFRPARAFTQVAQKYAAAPLR